MSSDNKQYNGELIDWIRKYKDSTSRLVRWVIDNSGHRSNEVTTRELVTLSQEIAARHITFPTDIARSFSSAIDFRTRTYSFWQQQQSSEEVKASNKSHKAFIDALERAQTFLTNGRKASGPGSPGSKPLGPGERGGSRSFKLLHVEYPADDEEGDRVPITPYAKKPEIGKPTPTSTPEARFAAFCFMQEFQALQSQMNQVWKEVAKGEVNVATAGALALAAAKQVKQMQMQFEDFQQIVNLCLNHDSSQNTRSIPNEWCKEAHGVLVRFITDGSDISWNPNLGVRRLRSNYCLLFLRYIKNHTPSGFSPTEFIKDLSCLRNVSEIQPHMVIQVQFILDSIRTHDLKSTPPLHLDAISSFKSRFIDNASVMLAQLKDEISQREKQLPFLSTFEKRQLSFAKKEGGQLAELESLLSNAKELGKAGTDLGLPMSNQWICGVGLSVALGAVACYGAKLWTKTLIPLEMIHLYNRLRKGFFMKENACLESLLDMWTSAVFPGGQRPEGSFLHLYLPVVGINPQVYAAKNKARRAKSGNYVWLEEGRLWTKDPICFTNVWSRWNEVLNGDIQDDGQYSKAAIENAISGSAPIVGFDPLGVYMAFRAVFGRMLVELNISSCGGDPDDLIFTLGMAEQSEVLMLMGDALDLLIDGLTLGRFKYFEQTV